MLSCVTASASALTALMPMTSVLLRVPLRFQRTTKIQNAWEALIDESNGYTYYYDAQTGQSQWEVPAEFAQQGGGAQASSAQVLWRLTGSAFRNSLNELSGVGGFTGVTGFTGADKSRDYEIDTYSPVVYTLCEGDEQVLSRWNMVEQALTVSRRQCDVQCLGGYATLVSNGRSATLWRERGGPWCSVPKGESLVLNDGDQVSLDCQDPEAAVFTCEAAQQGGSVQQGGSAQQGGWEQLTDQNGQVYYSNPQTGQTQWDPPQY